jgi:hypothetical protein
VGGHIGVVVSLVAIGLERHKRTLVRKIIECCSKDGGVQRVQNHELLLLVCVCFESGHDCLFWFFGFDSICPLPTSLYYQSQAKQHEKQINGLLFPQK